MWNQLINNLIFIIWQGGPYYEVNPISYQGTDSHHQFYY
jgi:hypothetical protein